MRTRRHWRPKPKIEQPLYRVNEHIRAPQLLVIDEHEAILGVMDTRQAIEAAFERGLDLVEVHPKGNPPVAKILNYGQLQYEEQKKKKTQKLKQKNLEIKCIRLSLRIGKHDLDNRLRQTEEFLEEGHQVRLELVLRGRERRYVDMGKQLLNNIVQQLAEKAEREGPLSIQDGRISQIIRASKTKKDAGENSDEDEKNIQSR